MQSEDYSKNIANAIDSFLTNDDWKFFFDDKHGMFRFGLSLTGRIKEVNFLVHVKADAYVVYAISPIGADAGDAKEMAAMADFICRANYGLLNGNFELDMRDGEIRYKSYVYCGDFTPTADMVRESIVIPARMFDRYSAGIVDIIFNDASAKEAAEVLRAFLGVDESEIHSDSETSESDDSEPEG